jgi:hypothetical protein
MEQFSTELLTLVIGILSLLTSITIAFILHNASKKIETQNFSNSLRASWIDIDSTVLADDRLLEAIDDLLHPGYKGSPIAGSESRRAKLDRIPGRPDATSGIYGHYRQLFIRTGF